jgi:hypothetical protein
LGKATPTKRPENFKVRQGQRPLSQKYRWSKTDIHQVASDLDLRQRVEFLQEQLTGLRKKLNKISKDKSDAATRPTQKVRPGGTNGSKSPGTQKASSMPSLRRSGTSRDGTNSASAPNVTRASSATVNRHPLSPAAGHLKQGTSIATSVTDLASPPLATTAPTEEPTKRNLPRVNCKSLKVTRESGPVKESDKPIFAARVTPLTVERPAQKELRKARSRKAVIADEDLTGYLELTFMFAPRTEALWNKMHGKAMSYLRDFDTTRLTNTDLYNLVQNAIHAAWKTPRLNEFRQGMKDEVVLADIVKNNKLVQEGISGKKGFFGKAVKVPKASK